MQIKEFIEKAIEGGWAPPKRVDKSYEFVLQNNNGEVKNYSLITGADIFLDPLAWQAVGKVEGWHQGDKLPTFAEKRLYLYEPIEDNYSWLGNMHRMIDALAEGKSIEEFLGALHTPQGTNH